MAVRPVEFSGMIQNTQELSQTRSSEQQRPMIQQDQVATQTQQQAQVAQNQVAQAAQSGEETFDPSRGGDGTGYTGNRNKKKEEKKKKQPVGDGRVRAKSAYKSFDLSV